MTASRGSSARRSRTTIEEIGHLAGYPIGRHPQRFVDVDVALGNASSGMAKQRPDGQLGEAEIACEAGVRVAQRVRSDAFQPGLLTHAVEDAHHADEMTVAPIGREEEGRLHLGLVEEQIDGG